MRAEILISLFREAGIRRWMWQCPRCSHQASIHTTGRQLMCPACSYVIHPVYPLTDYFDGPAEDVPVECECPTVTRWEILRDT
jgi:RNase P subunit RPR2